MDKEISNNEILELIKEILSKWKITKYEIEITEGSKKGAGFLSKINKATVKSTNGNYNLIIKSGFRNPDVRKHVAINAIFQREVYFYEIIFPALTRFQNERKLSLNAFKSVPKCFKTCDDDGRELLVLENIREENYFHWNGENLMDDAHMKLILKEYAKLHAISFAMQDQEPEMFERLIRDVYEIYDVVNPGFIYEVISSAKKVSNFYPVDSGVYKSLQKLSDTIIDFIRDLETNRHEFVAILHGDCWCNNMMFKYGEQNQPIELRFFDFQMVRIASPVMDLSVAMYSNASPDVYRNLDIYLKYYYQNFTNQCKLLGSDGSKLYPYDKLKSDWKKYCRFGLYWAVIVHKVLLTTDEETCDITDIAGTDKKLSDVFNKDIENEEVFKERLMNITQHMYESGYLE